VAAVVYFGPYILAQVLVSYVVGGIIEVAFALIRKREIEEGFLVTGLIFPLTLPPTAPLWVVAVGVAIGVFFGKEVFGGTGRNIFNPALVGRLFITIGFPGIMSARWVAPFTDAITSATPLAVFKSAGTIPPYMDLLLGQVAGSAGEVFRIGIIAGGILLIVTRVSSWRIPVFYIGTVAAVSAVGNAFLPETIAPPLFQLLSGGLLFGAFFMATDPITSTATRAGKIVFGIGCGLVTVVVRSFTGFTEGVMFSIVFMNAFAPWIDTIVINRKYPAVQS
jgi:Na+-transporting NADH:ubiquinone oxidoreductase subunit B/electron transport complex protein RnfD